MKRIAILGSTGSIGVQALDVCRRSPERFRVTALTANRNIALLEQQVREFSPQYVVTAQPQLYPALCQALRDLPVKVLCGTEGICQVAADGQNDMVLNAIVGIAGLRPTLAALEAGIDLALANKESLVTGGELVLQAARESGAALIPVDSEHSAIFQCIQGLADPSEVSRILLTASGGPFYGKKREELQNVRAAQALRHPNWDMGAKITIDSATLMNKGLELIEACHLFHKRPEEIEIVVQRESIIHSMIQCVDGAILAQMGAPDMRVPIQYAFTWPQRTPLATTPVDFARLGKLTFGEPDEETFLCLKACKEAYRRGGLYPSVVNGANEEAVSLFLRDRIGFLEIGKLVWGAMESVKPDGIEVTLENILTADHQARTYVKANTGIVGGR